MSNQIVKALEHAAQKVGSALAKDAGKAVKDLYRQAGKNLKTVAKNVREIEEKHAADLKKIMEGGRHDLPHPRAGGGSARRGRASGGRGKGRERVRSPREAGRREDAKCPGGEPVDTATGRMFIHQTDASLPGSLPLLFVRNFESGYQAGRWMGPRWTCTFDERLEIDDEGVVYLSPDLVTQAYPHPEPGDDPVFASAGARWELALTDHADYTLTDPSTGTVREFTTTPEGDEALLTQVRDRHGRHYTLTYDQDGTPQSITHSGGYHLLVTTDNERITALRLARGAEDGHDALLLRYGYTDGHLSSVYNSSGKPMRFANDQTGRILSWTDRNNSQYLYTYDQFDRVTDEGGADGTLRFHFTYGEPDPDTGLKTHTETNALGHTTTYTVNQHAQITAITNPLGHTTHTERDQFDRLLTETDPLGRTTRYEYDGAGDLTTITRPDGQHATAEYAGQLSLPTLITEPGDATWRQTYDETGCRTSLTDPLGGVTWYSYDELGHVASITDALGSTTRVRHDAAGRLVEVVDPTGAARSFEYDSFGRAIAATDPAGGVLSLAWTIEGYLAKRSSADGTTESWTYDGEGNMLTYIDQLGQATSFEYTHFETLAARVAPDGGRITLAYNDDMQLTCITNEVGQEWTFSYDDAGRLIGETDFQQRTIGYELDAAGQVVSRTNPLGQSIRFGYDSIGRTVTQDAAGRVSHYSYDAAGHLVRARNPDADVVRTVDRVGNVLSESVNGRTVANVRDTLGRRIRRTTPSGHTSVWAYDQAGRPTRLATSAGTLDFMHDPAGREEQRLIAGQVALTSTWDARHRLTGLTVRAQQQVLQQRSYKYRPDGSLGGVHDLFVGSRTFDLDPAGRVVAVHADTWTETYAYDLAGNLTHAAWPASGAMKSAIGTRTYAGTELATAGRVRYEYDQAGRIILRQVARPSRKPDTWTFSWDAEDHLTGVTTPDGSGWRYLYDPFGRRVTKQRLAVDGAIAAERIDFTWDGSTLAEQTTRAPDLPGPYTLSWDHDGLHPLAQSEAILTPDTPLGGGEQERIDRRFFAIVTDLVGTPTELIDPATGTVAWRASSTLWGNTTWPAGSTYTPLRFPGQYFDPETRLHYNLHRYYDPETARYTSPDPLGLDAAPNPDTYVHNPHTWCDPIGLSPHPRTPQGGSEKYPGVGTIVNQDGVHIQIYSNDHAPAHAHVKGKGQEVRIGQNGKPLRGEPELSSRQQKVVDENIPNIRRNIRASMARHRGA